MLNHRTGDLLESGADYICHQDFNVIIYHLEDRVW